MSILDDIKKAASDAYDSAVSSARGELTRTANDAQTNLQNQARQYLSEATRQAVASALRSIEIRTGVAPPVRFTAADIAAMVPNIPVATQQKAPGTQVVAPKSVGRSSLLDIVRPTVIVDSPLFDKPRVYSTEHGIAGPDDYKRFKTGVILTGIGVLGLAFIGGMRYERSKRLGTGRRND